MIPHRLHRGLAAALIGLAASCHGGGGAEVVEGGPLEVQEASTFCLPAAEGDASVTWGVIALSNTAATPILIEDAQPADGARGLAVEAVRVRPVSGRALTGVHYTWPPDGEPLQDVDGFVVEPGTVEQPTTAEVVARLRLEDPAEAGELPGLRLRYQHDDATYETVRRTGMQLLPAGEEC